METADGRVRVVSRISAASVETYRRLLGYRRVVPPIVDCSLWVVTLPIMTYLRYQLDFRLTLTWRLALVIALAISCQLLTGFLTQLYRVRWRIASFEEALVLGETIFIVTVVVSAVNAAWANHVIPASSVIAAGAATLALAQAIRWAWRLTYERTLRPGGEPQRAIIFGVGKSGIDIVGSLLSNPDAPYLPVALLDDDPSKSNMRVRQLRVSGGLPDLGNVARRVAAEAVIVAIPRASSELIRRVSVGASEAGLMVRVLPPVDQILSAPLGAEDIRVVTPEDLLGRRVIETHVEAIAGYLTGSRVLVTGAGGSIGSELCRQINRFAPQSLVMLDRDESGLHATQLSLDGRAQLDTRALVVCDIRDRRALDLVFSEHQPDVVFHAAALKHLPLLEMWPAEAVKTNVHGTENLLEVAALYGVDRFVNVSTDKAVNPTSVLGYTKRVAERLTAWRGRDGSGTYLSVRFGNVLGSRGSVLTTFRSQVAVGGPLTVTHPEVSRFFMTIQEAVELVIQAAAVGNASEVLVLDMGEPVKISDLAKRLALESQRPIRIVYTGLRPAEKLREEMFGADEVDIRPVHPWISHVMVPPLDAGALGALDEDLGSDALKATLRQLCFTNALPASRSGEPLSVVEE